MNLIDLCGWVGQALFFSRFLIQWIQSERARRSVTPVSFWWLSLTATVLLIVFTVSRHEPVLLFGYATNLGIYARNLWIAHARRRTSTLGPIPAMLVAVLLWAALFWSGASDPKHGYHGGHLWFAIAVVGQAFWSARFLVQWWYTERSGESHFPRAFWWCSLAGTLLLLAYAIYLREPVWIAGFVPGPIVQVRNLMLSSRAHAAATRAATDR